MRPIDQTHAADLRSWVESANDPAADFPIQNLPFGIYQPEGSRDAPTVGVAIGDQIANVAACAAAAGFTGAAATAAACCSSSSLNALMALGPEPARALRQSLSAFLESNSAAFAADSSIASRVLVPMHRAALALPADIGDYTDFYASIHHATNVGSMFRPDNPLLPNYKWVPIGYHGRASSIVASGAAVQRPVGQTRDAAEGPPVVGPSRRLDYELEVGLFIGRGNALGAPIGIGRADDHIFGLCLVNDWSARDMQTWEYQPLGPFLAKNFVTTISPWVVTLDALAPFRIGAARRPASDPAPLPYLSDPHDAESGGFEISLDVLVSSSAMRDAKMESHCVSHGSFADMYWTFAQLVAHHASGGCNLRPGDLLASGTVSGPTKESRGCLLERAWRGTEPIELPTGETRAFLADGDEVVFRGYCERDGYRRIGFGECRGRVVPALGA